MPRQGRAMPARLPQRAGNATSARRDPGFREERELGRCQEMTETWRMRGRRMMWTGMIGFIVGLVALAVCLILPAALGPNVSWGEAMLGIIPSGVLTLAFLVLMLIGMATMMSHQQDRSQRRSRRDD